MLLLPLLPPANPEKTEMQHAIFGIGCLGLSYAITSLQNTTIVTRARINIYCNALSFSSKRDPDANQSGEVLVTSEREL